MQCMAVQPPQSLLSEFNGWASMNQARPANSVRPVRIFQAGPDPRGPVARGMRRLPVQSEMRCGLGRYTVYRSGSVQERAGACRAALVVAVHQLRALHIHTGEPGPYQARSCDACGVSPGATHASGRSGEQLSSPRFVPRASQGGNALSCLQAAPDHPFCTAR